MRGSMTTVSVGQSSLMQRRGFPLGTFNAGCAWSVAGGWHRAGTTSGDWVPKRLADVSAAYLFAANVRCTLHCIWRSCASARPDRDGEGNPGVKQRAMPPKLRHDVNAAHGFHRGGFLFMRQTKRRVVTKHSFDEL